MLDFSGTVLDFSGKVLDFSGKVLDFSRMALDCGGTEFVPPAAATGRPRAAPHGQEPADPASS